MSFIYIYCWKWNDYFSLIFDRKCQFNAGTKILRKFQHFGSDAYENVKFPTSVLSENPKR